MALLSFAHSFEVGGIYYNITSSTAPYTVAVTYCNYNYTDAVAIPSSVPYDGKTYSVTSIGSEAFFGFSGLKSVTIPNSVTSIGGYAFGNCSNLTSITIPNSVTTIGEDAFNGTAWYDNQPNGLVYAGKVAYKYKGTMPNNTAIVLEDGTTGIAGRAFSGCSGLTSINIPNSVTSIGNNAFYDCSGLTSIEIPNSVTSIGSNAFRECSGLTSITIPNSVTSIGSYAFYNCSSLTSVTIGNSVTSIGRNAFDSCSGLTSVTIGNSVTSIGNYAFYGCSGLTSVNIPNSVTSIGNFAFYNCSGLTSVTIPNSVTSIGNYAFSNCSGLTSVTIGNSVTSIGDYAFYNCSGLTSVTIPNSVTNIGTDAFFGTAWYTAWYNNQPEGLIYLGKVAYKYKGTMPKNTVINLEEGTTEIASKAFYNCTGLTSITIPNSVTSIGSQAFYGCSGLTSVNIPNSVTSIGSQAFYGCSGLTSVTLPEDLASIGSNTFPDNSKTKLYVNIGGRTLLALWRDGYDYVYEIGTQNRLQPSSSLYLSSSTQTSVTIKVNSKYSGYTYTCGGENIGTGGITKTGLYPGLSQSVAFTVSKDGLYHSFSASFKTKGIEPIVSGGVTSASSLQAVGSYTKGDAVVTKTAIKCNGKEMEGNNLSVWGLNPNKSYTVVYSVTVQGNKTYESSKTFKTNELIMTTEQPKVVSVGNVIVSAKANVDDAETNVGFEWRRTDWTDDFKSNTGTAYMYEGTMEGYIRNLNAEKLWKFRPYYLADDGTYYYGDWMGLDPTNTSYFEPTVHTYANINIEGNTALVKGYALGGTDKITVQGFKYWKAANLAPSGDLALEARKASPAIPADAETIEAEGRVMEATLSGLDYECTYSYVAFAKTDEGTFYGEVKTFTTGPNTTGIEVLRDADSETKAVDDKVKGIYTLTGVKLSDDAADLKMLKRGIYIVNGRKVAVK